MDWTPFEGGGRGGSAGRARAATRDPLHRSQCQSIPDQFPGSWQDGSARRRDGLKQGRGSGGGEQRRGGKVGKDSCC